MSRFHTEKSFFNSKLVNDMSMNKMKELLSNFSKERKLVRVQVPLTIQKTLLSEIQSSAVSDLCVKSLGK